MKGSDLPVANYTYKMTVSIIIPVYNERDTIATLLDRVLSCGIDIHQVLVVDDGSTDGTREELERIGGDGKITILRHEVNRGKGAAVGTALPHATGDVVVIQDADLEYDPADLPALVEPILNDNADVVYGSRFSGARIRYVAYARQRWANRLLTSLSNLFTNLDLTDMECGYKAFRRTFLADIQIEESGFGFEPEITAKIAKKHPRLYEMGVSYNGRTYAEGKKISWQDGWHAITVIFKYNLWS